MIKFFEQFLPESMRPPVAASMLCPRVHYKTRTIADHNIRYYHDNGMPWGEADIRTGDIYVYKYQLQSGFELPATDVVYEKLQNPRPLNQVLAHERWHIRNAIWRKYYMYYTTNRYFDLAILRGLDEISAFTFGEGCNAIIPDNWTDMWKALGTGIDYMTSSSRHYRKHHAQSVRDCFYCNNDKKSERRQIKTLNKLIATDTVKYARSTNIIADYFLTFGDFRILAPGTSMPDNIKNKLRDFREEWENLTRNTFKEIRQDLISR